MRILLFCLTLALTFLANSQAIELQGRYGASFIGAESIEFVGKDSFYFGGFYCTYGREGKGVCEVKNGYLYLYFERSSEVESKKKQQGPILAYRDNKDSIVDIGIKVVDENDLPVPYATVQVKSLNKQRVGALTGQYGYVSFRTNNDKRPLQIETSLVGMETSIIKIDDPVDLFIKIYLVPDKNFNAKINNGEIFIYEIEELTEELITMRPASSKGNYREYHRK